MEERDPSVEGHRLESGGQWLGIGIGVGVALGTAFDDVALGLALGTGIGAALTAARCMTHMAEKSNGETAP